MAYEIITRAPEADDFTPLSEHQEQTPGTFFGSRAVLHLRSPNAKVKISRDELAAHSDFGCLGDGTEVDDRMEIPGVDVWVTSRHLMLWSASKETGIQIPYPTITLHAQVSSAVLLQLGLSDPNMTADEDLEAIQLLIAPTAANDVTEGTAVAGEARLEQELYDAISACQELNPDPSPDDEEDDDGGFDETAPGATGWITSENMADFMDEDGNFRMPAGATVVDGSEDHVDGGAEEPTNGLGAGAGTRRTAADLDTTDGADDEAKWQRTG